MSSVKTKQLEFFGQSTILRTLHFVMLYAKRRPHASLRNILEFETFFVILELMKLVRTKVQVAIILCVE